MEYRTLGRTGLKVSEVGFGAWAIGGPARLGMREIGWGQTNDSESLRALKAAFDAGINFFDTADAYGNGHSEELLGQAFSSERDKIIISSKGGNRTINGEWVKDFSSQWIEKAVAGIERLGFLTEDKDKTLAQAALQFVLSHPAVSVTIPGAKNPTQAVDNAGASDGLLLSQEELRRIRELVPSQDATLIK